MSEKERIAELKARITAATTVNGGGGPVDDKSKHDAARSLNKAIDEIRSLKGTYP